MFFFDFQFGPYYYNDYKSKICNEFKTTDYSSIENESQGLSLYVDVSINGMVPDASKIIEAGNGQGIIVVFGFKKNLSTQCI